MSRLLIAQTARRGYGPQTSSVACQLARSRRLVFSPAWYDDLSEWLEDVLSIVRTIEGEGGLVPMSHLLVDAAVQLEADGNAKRNLQLRNRFARVPGSRQRGSNLIATGTRQRGASLVDG